MRDMVRKVEYEKKYEAEHREQIAARKRDYYLRNKERLLEAGKQYRKNNQEKNRARCRQYRETHKDKIAIWAATHKEERERYQREYRQIHKKQLLENAKKYRRERASINFRIAAALRSRLKNALTLSKRPKSGSHIQDLGCTVDELRFYLEGKFQDGMTWENWGLHGWHIDHIIPLAYFDLTNHEQFLKACHYTNLQPLWAKENLMKGVKILFT